MFELILFAAMLLSPSLGDSIPFNLADIISAGANSNTNVNINSDTNSNTNVNFNTNTNSNYNVNSNSNININSNSNLNINANANTTPTSPGCGQENVTVVSGDKYDSRFSVENLLTHENKDIDARNYWLSPENAGGTFILNLGCTLSFDAIKLVNTHNAQYKDRSTKQFRLFTSMAQAGPWTKVLDKELEDSRKQQDPLPLQIIDLDTKITAQFVKFVMVTWYGKSGGLQYFDIQRTEE